MGNRRQSRIFALQALHLYETCKVDKEYALAGSFEGDHTESIRNFTKSLFFGVIDKQIEIDDLLKKYAQNWDLNRMAIVDKNILRMATYEVLYNLDTPISVIIDEAIEIAKIYSTQDSGKFVNGILDKIKSQRKN